MSKVYITAIRMSENGTLVKHITYVWYGTLSTKISTHDMAELIENGTHNAWVIDPDTGTEAQVLVVATNNHAKYLRTKADNDLKDNLLALPKK